jgi:hypothetical protein
MQGGRKGVTLIVPSRYPQKLASSHAHHNDRKC